MLEVITASNAVRGYTKPPQAAGMSCYSVAEEITSICADFLVELRSAEHHPAMAGMAEAGRS
jgi:hypothetical protein